MSKPYWHGVFPAITTQLNKDQSLDLAVQETGLGKEFVRAPRLTLTGGERKRVLKIIHDGIAKRPKLPRRKQPRPT
jgi:hypothetical protein